LNGKIASEEKNRIPSIRNCSFVEAAMISQKPDKMTVSEPVAMGLLLSFLLLMSAFLNIIRQADGNHIFSGKGLSCFRSCHLTTEDDPKGFQSNSWFLVPNWLAGTWQASSETVLETYDYRQGNRTISEPIQVETNRRSTIGMQCDNLGRIWYCASTPYERTVESSAFVEHQSMERITLMASSTKQLTVDCVATVSRSGKEIGATPNVFKEETITTYRPLSNNAIEAIFIINDFDLQGHPLMSSRAVCDETLVKPFTVINEDERGNLKQKFKEYLLANGLGDLLAFRCPLTTPLN
jgi:hypothetical protein